MLRFLRFPRGIPVRLPARQTGQKWLVAAGIAALAALIAVSWRETLVISDPILSLDDLLYDFVYRTRPPEDRRGDDVVIVAIDEDSITKLKQKKLEDVE